MAVARLRRNLIGATTLTAIAGSSLTIASANTKPKGVRGMKHIRFVVFHMSGPNWLPGKTLFEQPGVADHVGHYKKLLEAGKLSLAGPHLDDRAGGMMVPAADVTEAEIKVFAA